jgi:hypothetical protein
MVKNLSIEGRGEGKPASAGDRTAHRRKGDSQGSVLPLSQSWVSFRDKVDPEQDPEDRNGVGKNQ